MPWTASLVGKDFTSGVISVTVAFTDGVATVTKKYHVDDLELLKSEVKQEVIRLNRVASIASTLQVGELPAQVQPTPAEAESIAWNTKVNRLQVLVGLVNLGVFTGSEAQIVNLRTQIKNDFKPEYVGL